MRKHRRFAEVLPDVLVELQYAALRCCYRVMAYDKKQA